MVFGNFIQPKSESVDEFGTQGNVEYVIDMASRYWGKESEVSAQFNDLLSQGSPNTSQTIKTVGMVYNRLRDGGSERVITLLIDIFADMGLKTVFFTDEPAHKDDYKPKSMYKRVVLPSGNSPELYRNRADALARTLRELEIDVVIHHRHNEYLCFWDALIFKLFKIKCLMYKHGVFTTPIWAGSLDHFLRLPTLYQPYDGIITLSRVDALYWSTFTSKVFVMPNPKVVVGHPITSSNNCRTNKNPNEILWAGRLSNENNYDQLLDIMSLVIRECPNAHLTVCGKPNRFDDSGFIEFERNIKDRALDEHITLAGYQLDLKPYYDNASIFLFTASIGSWAMVLIEAMQASIPIVSYDLPWLELLRKGNGVLKTELKDNKDMAEKIISLINDKRLKETLVIESKKTADYFCSLDLKSLWQGVFNSLEENSVPVQRRQLLQAFWGALKGSPVDSDPEVTETFNLMIETYNKHLREYLSSSISQQ